MADSITSPYHVTTSETPKADATKGEEKPVVSSVSADGSTITENTDEGQSSTASTLSTEEKPKAEQAKQADKKQEETGKKEDKENKKQEEKPEEITQDKASTASRDEANKALSSKGIDLASYEQEYAKNGELSAESLDKLEKAGIPKTFVDAYIEGQKSILNTFIGEVKGIAGGDEGYNNVMSWADKNLSEEEKTAYNNTMNSGDKGLIKLAVHGLVAQYNEVEGKSPNLITGSSSAKTNSDTSGFANESEMVSAMSDKRYARDPIYTRQVEEKVKHSTFM